MHIHPENHRVLATKAELIALASHASKDDSRPHLNAILFGRPGGFAIATDGHRMIRCLMGMFGATQKPLFAVPLDTIQQLIKTMVAGDTAEIGAKGISCKSSRFKYKQIEAKFPPYADIFAQTDPYTKATHAGVSSMFNVAYLKDAALMSLAADEKSIRIYSGPTNLHPLAITAGVQWTMIVMPMRFPSGENIGLRECTNVGPAVAPVKRAS